MEFIDGIPVYMVDGLDSEVTAISLVSEPAIMESFVTFNKDKKMEMFMNNDKMQVMGPVLIPDQKIYRNNDGYEYYIVFSQNAIEQLSRKFLTELRNNQWSIQHEEETSSVSIVESWIKTGSEDKSNMFGFNMPVGTWMVTAQINDIDLWQKIKRGDMTGFSIEAWLNLDEITNNFNKQSNMNKEEKMAKFVETLKQFISEFLESDEPATNEVEPKEEEVVEEETSEPENKEEENVEVEIPEPAEDNELVVEEAPESIEPEPEQEQENLSSVIAELEAKLKELEDENSSLQDKVENLSKQPSAEPVNVNAKKTDSREFLKQIANKF